MCGIIGYIGLRPAAAIVLNGLRRLEYRGYDSAGLAVLHEGRICVQRATGKLGNLEAKLQAEPGLLAATHTIGIGHTRWATHGGVTEHNAHPHLNEAGTVAVIHNGIVENFVELKAALAADGARFRSETDTEVIPHLVDRYMKDGMSFERAAFAAIGQLRGSNAVVMMCADAPDMLIAARLGNAGGIVIGLGEGEQFVASDVPGILEHTRRVIFLDDGEVGIVRLDGLVVRRLDGTLVHKKAHAIPWDPVSAEKGEYRHFMQKEIFEQARAITDTLRGRVNFQTGAVHLEQLALDAARLPARVHAVACGTSLHAGLIGRFYIERIAHVPVEVDYGSEYRYRDPLVGPGMAVLGITQSGETADTLAAMSTGRERGAQVWAIVNMVGSQAERMASGVIHMRAGPEIGVCSTKTFLTSIVDQYLLACALAQASAAEDGRSYALARALAHLPGLVSQMLDATPIYQELANRFHDREHFLFLGRGVNYPIALEGALKLKEISYIHAEGYPAGEMKHGPIALIDEKMPVVCVAVHDSVYEKMVSQIEQVKARGGTVIAIATAGDEFVRSKADYVIEVPPAEELLVPVLTAIPMQRLAYEMAVRLGCDVDQPRNLAKSVTVE
jgi:glucosamine--fructose-6-phosphate aminotransferase (isomerizing)